MKRRFLAVVLCVMLLASVFAAPASAASVAKIMKVNVQGARLRKGPGNYSWSKPSLKKGQKVLYLGKHKNAFYYVYTTGGRTGWVYKSFLSDYGAVNNKQVYRATKAGYLYNSNSTKSGHAAKVRKNEYVFVYTLKGTWAYVKKMNGKGGYIKASRLKK